MSGIDTNANDVAAALEAKSAALERSVSVGMSNALAATDREAVKLLSGSNGASPWSYPVPARTGNLRSARDVSQPSPGVGVIAFLADYAYAIYTGVVSQWAGRGKTRIVQRVARPFADDAVANARPSDYVIDAVEEVLRA
ncbi:MAG TPA: hypothetical protein VFB54_03515 [Burkholderiales bacterium]|nr:hypothetical protein [Burkholderiales bacterium]